MIFDGHADIWSDIGIKKSDRDESNIFKKYHLENLRKGNITGSIFSIWVDSLKEEDTCIKYSQFAESVKEEIACNADVINIIKTYGDFESGLQEKKINVVTGLEGLSHIKDDVDMLDFYYSDIHARHATLTWNETNPLATPWLGDPDRGLTETGKKAIKRMENLGMVVDVSHINEKSFWDIISICSKPIIASHSNAITLCGHGRNLNDNQIKEIAKTGGLIGINAFKKFVSGDSRLQTVEGFCNHIDHISNLVGTSHIALGFDFMHYFVTDNYEDFSFENEKSCVKGLGCAAETNNLIEELKSRNYSADDIENICYNNYMRLFEIILK